jgi:hypothetical protein
MLRCLTMKKKSVPAALVPSDTRTIPLHQDIATQAYVLWNHYGQPAGRDVGIWLEAERQVLGVDNRISQQAGGAVDAKSLSAALAAEPLEAIRSPAAGQAAFRQR